MPRAPHVTAPAQRPDESATAQPTPSPKPPSTAAQPAPSTAAITPAPSNKAVLVQAQKVAAKSTAWLAIIIDDLGGNLARDRQVLALAPEIALAILPDTPHASVLAQQARAQQRTVLLHLPMAPASGPYAWHPALDSQQRLTRLEQALKQVPGARGVNNHMGSQMTSQRAAMDELMQTLASKDLFFVDSRTTAATQAAASAQHAQLASLSRDIFLDDNNELNAIRHEWRSALHLAQQQGSALVIGHPYPNTLRVLREELPTLKQQGVQLLALEPLIALRGNRAMPAHGKNGRYTPKAPAAKTHKPAAAGL
nr:divergent polysaccharide deacetylase family protein [Atopomonas sediminilitoris]